MLSNIPKEIMQRKIMEQKAENILSSVSNKLKNYNYSLYSEVQNILKNNFLEKHIRGGIATKKKYEK